MENEGLFTNMQDNTYHSTQLASLLARTADRTPKTFALQGDPSRPTQTPSSKRCPYIVSPAGRDVTWNDLAHSWRIFSPNRDIDKIPAPLRSHISSPNLTPPRWSPSPQLDQVQESTRPQQTIGERFMVKEESAASVGTDLGRPREEVLLCPLPLCFSWV
ncbi:hypothetical protein AVEN_162225-1 [Araneus ventricosus]|uniref:Uncharacterized protein n=1 Tax=Araneus ventricosus TaxID=182803 RepID=A0A4Y2EZS4_ARAVE|nr:hypothetical protein AVEN_162225-1 [Araneus ventricosus]